MVRLIVFILVLLMAGVAHAQVDLTLGWDYAQEEEANITEFIIYYADNSTPSAWLEVQLQNPILPAAREQDVQIAGTAQVCFMMRAANGAVLSVNSNVICWTVPPPPPPDPDTPDNLHFK